MTLLTYITNFLHENNIIFSVAYSFDVSKFIFIAQAEIAFRVSGVGEANFSELFWLTVFLKITFAYECSIFFGFIS